MVIENYYTETSSKHFSLNRKRTKKDFFDYLTISIRLFLAVSSIYFLILYRNSINSTWVYLALLLVLIIYGVSKGFQLVSLLSLPLKHILYLDKTHGFIELRKTPFGKKKIQLERIDFIKYELQSEKIKVNSSYTQFKTRHWSVLQAELKNGEKYEFAIINNSQILDLAGENHIENKLKQISKSLTKLITSEIKNTSNNSIIHCK